MTFFTRHKKIILATAILLMIVVGFGLNAAPALKQNQKALMQDQNSLIRWAVDSHHTRRGEQSVFQAVTRLPGFTHQTHRTNKHITNKNNPQIASEIVFSSLWSTVLPLETQYSNYITPKNLVKCHCG